MSRQPDLFAIPRAAAPSLMELRARRDALLREVLRSWPDDTGIDAESDMWRASLIFGVPDNYEPVPEIATHYTLSAEAKR